MVSTVILIHCNIAASQKYNQETLLLSSQSPDEKYNLYAYKTNPHATVDFSIKVYLVEESGKRKLIYNAYHEYDAEIIWIDNEIVLINDKTLDLSKGEKYDWRRNKNGNYRGE